MIAIRRALLSVSDKRGLADLGTALVRHGCELISTGGTAAALREAGLAVTPIEAVTGNPEAFGGRMKTLSFQVGSALLFDRERDGEEAARLGIGPIDLVVCNLYPFAEGRARGAGDPELVELIDVGGPTMLRAAAKNHRWVAAVCDPADYPALIEELDGTAGRLSDETRRRLMGKVFAHTAAYDSAIAAAFGGEDSLSLTFEAPRPLRYGENSHQAAAIYREAGTDRSLYDARLLAGKELSFNNMADLGAALEAVRDLSTEESAFRGCAVVKHLNPCGLAVAPSQHRALELAWQGDPLSAFGSVIAFDHPVELETVHFFRLDSSSKTERRFVEVVAAPEFAPEAVEHLRLNPSLRVVVFDPAWTRRATDLRLLPGALLVQDADELLLDGYDVVTADAAVEHDDALVRFGLRAVRQVRSNAIVIVRRTADGGMQLLGAGGGQPNRVVATRLALEKARQNLAAELGGAEEDEGVGKAMGDALLVSDAFFPFPDSIEAAAEAGIRRIYQPGGSIRDRQVVRRCNELGVSMVFTAIRHFRH